MFATNVAFAWKLYTIHHPFAWWRNFVLKIWLHAPVWGGWLVRVLQVFGSSRPVEGRREVNGEINLRPPTARIQGQLWLRTNVLKSCCIFQVILVWKKLPVWVRTTWKLNYLQPLYRREKIISITSWIMLLTTENSQIKTSHIIWATFPSLHKRLTWYTIL